MVVSTLALVLVLGCAVAYSGLDLLRKLLAGRMGALPLLFYFAAGTLPVFAVWWLAAGDLRVGAGYLAPGLTSVALNIGANLAFLEAVRASPLSLTIPFLSLTPVFTTVLAVPLLGELPTPLQMVGILAVVVGAFWLNLEAAPSFTPRGLWRALAGERGSLLMILVALLWSLAMPLDKIAMANASVPFHGLALNGGVAAGTLALLAGRRGLGELRVARRHWPLLTLAVVLTVLAIGLQLEAMTRVWVGFVETLKRGLGSFLALLLGRLVFTESIGRHRVAAVLAMAGGVALILL